MVKEPTCIEMEHLMLVIGLKINSMVLELRDGQMVLNMKDSMKWVWNMELEHSYGVIKVPILDNLYITIFMVKVFIVGQMVESILAIGRIIKWMVKVSLLGKMAGNLFIFIIIRKYKGSYVDDKKHGFGEF